jgi:arylsulfatase A-like enzyme
VLLISIDTLRADRLGCYGYGRGTSPFLDSMAARGIRFENAFVNTHGTPPSHATLFSSLYQQTHRVSIGEAGDRARHRIPESLDLLPERLRKAGYRTIGITGGGFMSEDFGFDRGFEIFDQENGIEKQVDRLISEVAGITSGGAAGGTAGGYSGPIFAFLHTYEIHSPYDPPPGTRSRFVRRENDFEAISRNLKLHGRDPDGTLDEADLAFVSDLYDAGIRHTDDHLRRLFTELEALGFFRNHLVVIGSDHGEELGDHGHLLHPATLYEELLRVPLILTGTRVRRGHVSRRLASTVDVAPTIYAATGVDPPTVMEGHDLLSPLPEDAERRVYSQYAEKLYSVRTARFKLILDQRPGAPEPDRVRLYDLRVDPEEKRNLAEARPRMVEELHSGLEDWLGRLEELGQLEASDVELDAERLEELRSLGYVD